MLHDRALDRWRVCNCAGGGGWFGVSRKVGEDGVEFSRLASSGSSGRLFLSDIEEDEEEAEELEVRPGRYCSPRHRMPFN